MCKGKEKSLYQKQLEENESELFSVQILSVSDSLDQKIQGKSTRQGPEDLLKKIMDSHELLPEGFKIMGPEQQPADKKSNHPKHVPDLPHKVYKTFKKNIYRQIYNSVIIYLKNNNKQLQVQPDSSRNFSRHDFLKFVGKLTHEQKILVLKGVHSKEFKRLLISGKTDKYKESKNLKYMNWINLTLKRCLRPAGDMHPQSGINTN